MFILISPTILYLASLLLFPRESNVDSAIDFKTHYYANHRAFFILFGLFTPVDVVDSLLKGVPHFLALGPAYFISALLYFAGLVTAAITCNERYHVLRRLFSHADHRDQLPHFSSTRVSAHRAKACFACVCFSAFRADLQHDTKPRFAAHHPVIGFGCSLQWINFVHRLHTIRGTEFERVLRID